MIVTNKLAKIKLVAMDVDGTFTDGTLYYDSKGEVIKGFSAHDGMGLELLRRAGIIRGFITGRHDNATEARANYLKVDFYISAVGDKETALNAILEEHGIAKDEALFIGDDLNDLTGFAAAGVKVAVANACDEIKAAADFVTEKAGGAGAVRELVNTILKAKGVDIGELWMSQKQKTVGMQ